MGSCRGDSPSGTSEGLSVLTSLVCPEQLRATIRQPVAYVSCVGSPEVARTKHWESALQLPTSRIRQPTAG